ncbi:MAG: Ig-like domain-containing protein, partial [Desulfotomaculaceae bacterium]
TSSPYFWNTSSLPTGNNYIVRVTASDGILTAQDQSNGPFTIDNTPPSVNLTAPPNNSIASGTITVSATATDNISVAKVDFAYSPDGITYTLISSQTTPVSGNTYSTPWNTSPLTSGSYKLRATAFDQCNNSAFSEINVIVDEPPTVTLVSPNGGELVCQGINITWTASDPDGDPLTFTLEYSSNGGTTFTTIASGLTSSPYFWNTSSLPTGNNYIVRVTASDGILTAQDQSNGPFTVDNTPPSVNLTAPPNNSIVSGTITISASATDNVGVARVDFEYSADGITYFLISSQTTPVSGNTYSTTWDTTAVPGGNYKLRATAFDQCNKFSSSIRDVIVDQPPEVTVTFPNGGEIICLPGTTITWTASDPDGDPLTYSILYSADGGATFTLLASSITTTSFFWDTSSLSSGDNYLIKVVAFDGYLTAEDVSDAPFTIDNTPPVLIFKTPLNGDFISDTITLIASATDNVSVTGVTFEYSSDGGSTFNLIGTVTVPFNNDYALPWDTTTVSDGPKIIRATAADQCNNITQQQINVVVDNTPPAVQIPSPTDGSTVSGTVPILVTAQDNECLAKVELYIDGQLVRTITLGNVKTSEFVFDWDTTEFAEGSHVVKAVATDCAGLTAVTENTYIVDNLPEHFTQLLVDGELVIPEQKPDAERITDFTVTTLVKYIDSFNTIDGYKILVKGFVDMGVTYVATDEQQTEHFAHFSKPFTGMILWPDLDTDKKLCPVILVEHEQHHLLSPRTIKKDIVLFVGVKYCCP